MKLVATYIFSMLVSCFCSLKAQDVVVRNLRCEGFTNPEGIDVQQPRLSWETESHLRNVVQTGYQILVASSPQKLSSNADEWNSGLVQSDQSIQIQYHGVGLKSGKKYWWKVKVLTNKGESEWSEPATWSVGLLHQNDWKALWIGYDSAFAWDSVTKFSKLSARYFRKEFSSKNSVKRATVFVSGLGLYELYLNGKKVGDKILTPAPTDYRKSVLYNTYDVTKALHTGVNAIGVVVGNGRYFTMRQQYKTYKINTFGFPKLLFQMLIEYEDGKQLVVSDASWKMTGDGPIRSNNEYDGEEYDARAEMNGWNDVDFDDRKWMLPQLISIPSGTLTSQMNECMKVMRSVKPVSVKQVKPKVFLVDMGQNFAGAISLKMEAEKGDTINIRFAESLSADTLYTANLRDAKATDVYITKKGKQTWQPTFVYHGFRYVEISNYPGVLKKENITGNLIYDDLSTIGDFQTSDSIINHIYQNAWWGIASNYKGMPVDCPQRNERMPWLGDRTAGALGESFVFDNAKLYAKWLDDIEQSQTAEGALPDVAPAFWNYYSDDVTWPAAYFSIADMLYHQFGDADAISRHYASMKRYLKYMREHYLQNNILVKDKYGDWCVPPESKQLIHARDSSRITDGRLIATAYYYHLLQLMQDFAGILHQPKDKLIFERLCAGIRASFNDNFYVKEKHFYGNNTVTANLLPLYFGLAPKKDEGEIFNQIVHAIVNKNNSHISTGVIGAQYLMRTLTRFGRADLAYTLASSTTYPSWGYMVKNGATTIWELWNGNTANPQMNSQNHVMLLGDLITWMYEDVAGIKSGDSSIAFKQIIMNPATTNPLRFAKASYHSPYGTIYSEWERKENQFFWHITIPPNTSALVYVPAKSKEFIKENGKPVSESEGIQFTGIKDDKAILKVGSGTYSFTSNL